MIATVVGGGPEGIPQLEANLAVPSSFARDAQGNLYVADFGTQRVYRIGADGLVRVFAGTGTPGFSGDGGPATSARLHPTSVVVGSDAAIYVADSVNHRVRRIDASGVITTIAGTGVAGFSGDGGPATDAQLWEPVGLAVDASGRLLIADQYNHRVRRIDAAGVITTVAGSGTPGFSGDAGPATSAQLNKVLSVGVDAAGNLYIADQGNQRIRRVDASGVISTAAGNGTLGFSGDGGPAVAAQLADPWGVGFDPAGNLLIADRANQRVRRVDAGGVITTIAGTGAAGFSGDGGPATSARLSEPLAMGPDGAGGILIADRGNQRLRRIDAAGLISTVAGNGTSSYSGDGYAALAASLSTVRGVLADSAGNLFIADRVNNRVRRVGTDGVITSVAGNGTQGFSGDGGPATEARVSNPIAIALDASGNLFIADRNNHRIRRVDLGGTITTIAGTGDANFSGDGGPAVDAELAFPSGLALDASGNLFIVDQANQRIRRVDPSGVIETVAGNGSAGFSGDGGPAVDASLANPSGVAVDGAGNLFIADSSNHRIRRVDAGQTITTVAGTGTAGFSGDGGAASDAQLRSPQGVWSAAGELYIADSANHRIRLVDSGGTIFTYAGIGTAGFSGDGGGALAAALSNPAGVMVDGFGTLFIADTNNRRIRRVTPGVATCGNGVLEGTEVCDQGAANGTPGSCCTPSCLVSTDAHVCRPVNGACDAAETCNGISGTCPADGFATSGTECRASSGVCDAAESCSGTSAACPANAFASASTPCGSSADTLCDNPDRCSGVDATCLPDFEPATSVCRPAAGACDLAETCDGAGACRADVFQPEFSPCGSPADADCDAPDSCNAGGLCVDRVDPDTAVCRPSAGACDFAERCNGVAKTCGADVREPAGTPCGNSVDNECTDPDTCNASGVCAANHQACALLTDPALCPLDVASGGVCDGPQDAHTRQFQLRFTPVVEGFAAGYRLSADTPDGAVYNAIVQGSPGANVNVRVTLPYPYVTAGDPALQVYDAATLGTASGCFQPAGAALQTSPLQVVLRDYLALCDTGSGQCRNGVGACSLDSDCVKPNAAGVTCTAPSGTACDATSGPDSGGSCTFTLPVALPASGQAYLKLQLAYGLEGSRVDLCGDGKPDAYDWTANAAVGGLDARESTAPAPPTGDVALENCSDYTFVHQVGATAPLEATLENQNAFESCATAGDRDCDGLADPVDPCPYYAGNAPAADADGDGRGDACECGDQNGDARTTVGDLVAINVAIFNPSLATALCDANGDGLCTVADIVATNVEIFSPTNTSTCAFQPVPGP